MAPITDSELGTAVLDGMAGLPLNAAGAAADLYDRA